MSAAPVLAAASAALMVLGAGRLAGTWMRAPRPTPAGRGGPLARRESGRRLAGRLERAAIPLGPDAFVAATAAAALAAAVLAVAVFRLPVAGPAAAVAVAAIAAAVVRSADRRYLARVEEQLPASPSSWPRRSGRGCRCARRWRARRGMRPSPRARSWRRRPPNWRWGAASKRRSRAWPSGSPRTT